MSSHPEPARSQPVQGFHHELFSVHSALPGLLSARRNPVGARFLHPAKGLRSAGKIQQGLSFLDSFARVIGISVRPYFFSKLLGYRSAADHDFDRVSQA